MNDYIGLIISSIGGILGFIVSYFIGIAQYTKKKKKAITIDYLIQAWRRLEKGSNREDGRYNEEIEAAIADIQLFGTKQQVELAQQLAISIATDGERSATPLLQLLCKDLRKELNLDETPTKLQHLRFQTTISKTKTI